MNKKNPVCSRRSGSAAFSMPAYGNPTLAPEKRAKDMLSRMTVEEKAAQMMCVWQEKAQKLEHSRLGIPVIFHEECLHGHAARLSPVIDVNG